MLVMEVPLAKDREQELEYEIEFLKNSLHENREQL